MAQPGAILAQGRDALAFFHSQVTNEVEGLEPGAGNYSARVTRTGQLVEFFSLHRLPDAGDVQSILLLLERESVPGLIETFDGFLFSDDVKLSDVSDEYLWSTVQGQAAAEVMTEVFAGSSEAWGELEAYSIRPLPEPAPPGSLAFCRSLTGDRGFVFAAPKPDDDEPSRLDERLAEVGRARGLLDLREPELSPVLEILRIEAGQVRVGPDTEGRKSILPETGLEQYAVSYTKGCYLGQEVIARVRTYGALPYGLRGLVFESDESGNDWKERRRVLERLPARGEDLVDLDGKAIGQIVSRTLSPLLEAPIAFAYLDKKNRTPGNELALRLGGETRRANVVLLPFYSAPDREERVQYLYDKAVRTFAQGREVEALEILESALCLDPSFSDGYEAVGVILGRSERFHEAIDIFRRLEELAPQEAMVNTNLSLYYMKIGDKTSAEEQAARAIQKSLVSGTSDPEAESRVAAEMTAQRIADAQRKRRMFEQVLEIDAEDGVALFGLGNALGVLGEPEGAASVYARASEADSDNSAIYLAQGKVLQELGRSGEAERVFRAGMEVASRKGDLMPLKEMEHRVLLLSGAHSPGTEPEDEPQLDRGPRPDSEPQLDEEPQLKREERAV